MQNVFQESVLTIKTYYSVVTFLPMYLSRKVNLCYFRHSEFCQTKV